MSAIIFDVGGVLLDYERDGMLRAIANDCSSNTMPDSISALIGELDLSGGDKSLVDFHAALTSRFDCSMSFERLCEVWVEGLRPRDWVRELLVGLSGKLPLYILSDTNAEHWQYIAGHILPLDLFDRIFLSHEMRLTKKTPKAFEYVLAEIPHTPNECLFIDDTSANIEIATQVGLRTHRYTDRASMIEVIERFHVEKT